MGWHCSDTAEFGLVDARGELITEQGFASRPGTSPLKDSPGVTGYATAARCVDLTRGGSQRETFGRPLSTRQVIRHTFVEMSRRTDVARSYIRNMTLSDEVTVLDAIYAKQTGVNCAAFVTDRAAIARRHGIRQRRRGRAALPRRAHPGDRRRRR